MGLEPGLDTGRFESVKNPDTFAGEFGAVLVQMPDFSGIVPFLTKT
jgi:hypothetical protein